MVKWRSKFQVVGIVPGPVVTFHFGTVDLSDETLPLEFIQKVYDGGCSYLQPIKVTKQQQVVDPE